MYRFFSRNSFAAYATLPFLLIVYRLRLILMPEMGFRAVGAEAATPMWNAMFGGVEQGSVASIVLSVVFALIAAGIINNLVNAFHFTERPSNMGGFLYIVLSSSLVVSGGLHPVHVFAVLFLVAINRLFNAASVNEPMRYCFEAAFVMSLGVLLWGKGTAFLPVQVLMLFMLRIFDLRSLLATILGWLCPLAMASTYFFCIDEMPEALYALWHCFAMPVSVFHTDAVLNGYIVAFFCLMAMSILSAVRSMPTLKIIECRYYRVMIWSLLIGSLAVLLPNFSFELLPLIATAGSVLMAAYLARFRRSVWQETITTAVAVVTLLVQWYV